MVNSIIIIVMLVLLIVTIIITSIGLHLHMSIWNAERIVHYKRKQQEFDEQKERRK